MAILAPRGRTMKTEKLKTPEQVTVAEETFSDPFQSAMLLLLRNSTQHHRSLRGPELIASVNRFASEAEVPIDEHKLRNRLRGMIRRGLIAGDEDGSVELTGLGLMVAGVLSSKV